MTAWAVKETNTHQDHVIAHLLGATVLGHFVWDETAFLLLDIGFIWNIYLDVEMGLLPHPVALSELEADELTKNELREDIDSLLNEERADALLKRMTAAPNGSLLLGVDLFVRETSQRLILTFEGESIVIETSLDTREIKIMTSDNKDQAHARNQDTGLADAVQAEHDFVLQRLREELGREPTEEEINEWLREHTEGY